MASAQISKKTIMQPETAQIIYQLKLSLSLRPKAFTDMTIDLIKSIISKGETRTLELKKSTGELKDAMHSLCAFLNTDGGILVFGVAPSSLKIEGQIVSDKNPSRDSH